MLKPFSGRNLVTVAFLSACTSATAQAAMLYGGANDAELPWGAPLRELMASIMQIMVNIVL